MKIKGEAEEGRSRSNLERSGLCKAAKGVVGVGWGIFGGGGGGRGGGLHIITYDGNGT